MWLLREHSVLDFCKHYVNVTFEYSLNIIQHKRLDECPTTRLQNFIKHFENIIKDKLLEDVIVNVCSYLARMWSSEEVHV